MTVIRTLFLADSDEVAATTPIKMTGKISISNALMNNLPGSVNHKTFSVFDRVTFFRPTPIKNPIKIEAKMRMRSRFFLKKFMLVSFRFIMFTKL